MSNDLYKFVFNADTSEVLRMYEIEGRRTKLEKTRGSTFEVESGTNELGETAVLSVTKSTRKKGVLETETYSDLDGDGLFAKTFEIEVNTSGVRRDKLERHQFTFDTNGEVVKDLELKKGRWKLDRIDDDEMFQTVDLDGKTYVVKSEIDRKEVEFEIFRDDNADGIWTLVAEGESRDLYVDMTTGVVDLVGLQQYLDASNLIG